MSYMTSMTSYFSLHLPQPLPESATECEREKYGSWKYITISGNDNCLTFDTLYNVLEIYYKFSQTECKMKTKTQDLQKTDAKNAIDMHRT